MSADIEQSPVEEAPAPPVVAEEAAPETPTEEAVERDVESDTLVIPDSSQPDGTVKYVPASALAGARKELKELKAELGQAKAGTAKAEQLEQQIAQLHAQVQQLTPYVQAYQAAVQQPAPAPVEDDSEAIELAKVLDLYDHAGNPDVAKAKKAMGLFDKRAKANAQAEVAPLQQRSVAQQSQFNLNRAIATELNGQKADPAILRQLWARVPADTTADPEASKHLWIQALGLTIAQQGAQPKKETPRTPSGQFTKAEDIPAPIYTEKAGGKDTPPAMPLNDFEKRMAKDMGISEKEYLERAKSAPWLR